MTNSKTPERNFYIEEKTIFKPSTYKVLAVSLSLFIISLLCEGIFRNVFFLFALVSATLWPLYFTFVYKKEDVKESSHLTISSKGIYCLSNNRMKKIRWKDVDILKYNNKKVIIYSKKSAPLTLIKKEISDFDIFLDELKKSAFKNGIKITEIRERNLKKEWKR